MTGSLWLSDRHMGIIDFNNVAVFFRALDWFYKLYSSSIFNHSENAQVDIVSGLVAFKEIAVRESYLLDMIMSLEIRMITPLS